MIRPRMLRVPSRNSTPRGNRVYLAQIEGQTKVPSLATLEKLAKALRVKVVSCWSE